MLNTNKMQLSRTGTESQERRDQGLMVGAMVCLDSQDNRIILVANSGVSRQLEFTNQSQECPEWIIVPPVVDPSLIEEALGQNDGLIHSLTDKINSIKSVAQKKNFLSPDASLAQEELHVPQELQESQETQELQALQAQRKLLCNQSLQKVYDLYSFHCASGKVMSLNSMCQKHLPPTGTGECCAPKLLDYAYKNNWKPVSMSELYVQPVAQSVSDEEPVAPCDERCGLILPHMLGLNILYRDEEIIVVNKQSGVLSVPGRGPEKQDCIVNRLRTLFPNCIEQPSVHRLDMETSGLLVLAFTKESHRNLCRQFEEGTVHKEYTALLDGILAKKGIPPQGQMELYFRLDVENRPHQIWDSVYGKRAVTQWNVLNVEKYRAPDGSTRNATRVRFIPHTGRTHQLRLASADSHGFGVPIIGDTLYGHCQEGERLMLHARYLEFTHPATGQRLSFTCPEDF